MQSIHTVAEAEAVLQKYVPKVATYTGDDMSLVRMWPLLELVGNPQDSLIAIHIAGTSGKTSTAYFVTHCLLAAGCSVGLTVSPHVDSITERLQINGAPIADSQFCSYLEEFLGIIESSDLEPSYFELLTVFELWVFAKEHLDYVVIETGMGGLYDATNVLTRTDKICVITDIGLDHTHILGDTIQEIAAQKAGIIHAGNQVHMHRQSSIVHEQIDKRSNVVGGVTVHIIEDDSNATSSILPLYQQRNWKLAKFVCDSIAKRDGILLDPDFDPAQVIVPGRMETHILQDGTTLIMDGAHNDQKMRAFVGSFQQLYPESKAAILLALKEGKEQTAVLDALKPIAAHIIITTFNTSQDLPAVSQDPKIIQEYAQSIGIQTSVEPDQAAAYSMLLQSPQDIRIVTGSFYLLGQIRVA